MSHVGKAVDTVCKQEYWEVMASGDGTLIGNRYLGLYSWENVTERQHRSSPHCGVRNSKAAERGALKEVLRQLWPLRLSRDRLDAPETVVLLGDA
jgi:hypothetical protein